MRQIDVNRLSGMVTPTAVRANKVRRDPAVVKAAKQAVTDTRRNPYADLSVEGRGRNARYRHIPAG